MRASTPLLVMMLLTACGARGGVESPAPRPTIDASVPEPGPIDGGPPACVPACGDRECGPDPRCGIECGACSPREVCSVEARCERLEWRTFPSPTGAWLNEVWGTASDDAWIVGGSEFDGTPSVILHFDGAAWREVPSPSSAPLYGVWGFARDDVWAVGAAGTILHWDGAGWAPFGSPVMDRLMSVWGSSSNDVWAGGTDGALLHFDGVSWSVVPVRDSPRDTRMEIWGSGPDDVWSVGGPTGGTDAAFVRFDGSAWSAVLRRPVGINALWGSSSSDVWAVADSRQVFHFDGRGWEWISTEVGAALYDVWGSGPSDVWATGWGVILRYDGASWTEVESPATEGLFGVWGSSRTDAWAVGSRGTILRYGPEPRP